MGLKKIKEEKRRDQKPKIAYIQRRHLFTHIKIPLVLDYFFISYSKVDGETFTKKLAIELNKGTPSFPVWLDSVHLKPGIDWDDQIDEAIKKSKALLYVMSEDSVLSNSVCKHEWVRALRFKKSIIPLLIQKDIEVPFRLSSREHISFLNQFEPSIDRLRNHLAWLDSKEGRLQALKIRLADAQRELPRTEPERKDRVLDDIKELKTQIEEMEEVINNPTEAAQRVSENIEQSIRNMMAPSAHGHDSGGVKIINAPPLTAPSWFQNRFVETRLVYDFLRDPSYRLMTIIGRGGIGKTAMVSRLLRGLGSDNSPDDGNRFNVSGILYLSDSRSLSRISYPELFEGLTQFLSEAEARKVGMLYKNPNVSTSETIETLLSSTPTGCFIVLLDNFEDELDNQTGNIKDRDLLEALRTILRSSPHSIKLIITSRIVPLELALVNPALQNRLDLDSGLEYPFAENALRAMDVSGKVGLKHAPENLLKEARERTAGHPRALEYLYGILSADRDTSLIEILDDTKKLLPEQVVHVLVGEAFNRLDHTFQMVMKALAVFKYPVPPGAIDYLLQDFIEGIDSKAILGRLVNMQFVRRSKGLYFLHQIDREYAYGLVATGIPIDRQQPETVFTRYALLHKAANWFFQVRKPIHNCTNLEELSPCLSEFELRLEGNDYSLATEVLLQFDYKLLSWGHFKHCIDLHLRLEGKITNPLLLESAAGTLGTAYLRMGEHSQSISYFIKALEIAENMNVIESKCTWICNLGAAYGEYGSIEKSIYYCEEAIKHCRNIGAKSIEATTLSNLGWWTAQIGSGTMAIDYYQQSLGFYETTGELENACITMADMGDSYAKLGDYVKSASTLQQSLALSSQNFFRFPEVLSLNFTGKALSAQGLFEEGLAALLKAIRLSDDTSLLQFQKEARHGVARIHIFTGQFESACKILEEAQKFNYPLCNYETYALQGMAAMFLKDPITAEKYFHRAIYYAEEMLQKTPRFFDAFDMKAMACFGLAVNESSMDLATAIESYKAARAINRDDGIVTRMTQLLDAIKKLDSGGILKNLHLEINL